MWDFCQSIRCRCCDETVTHVVEPFGRQATALQNSTGNTFDEDVK